MTTLTLALVLFTGGSCPARLVCESDRCEGTVTSQCAMTEYQCLEASTLLPDGTLTDVQACDHEPFPKAFDL